MFGTKKNITIRVKLYSGLDCQAKIDNYDPDSGIDLQVENEARLKKVMKILGLSTHESTVGFINGKKAGLSAKVNNGDAVYFMKPVSGG
jgi:molybdopterin converting factor small subunit